MNKKILITAGPTHEAIDPVRFIGNYSSGKMGFALADAFAEQGADVTVVAGPTEITPGNKNVKLIRVTNAEEMYLRCKSLISKVDIAVFSAAVADFTPEFQSKEKIKREKDDLILRLKPTVDIAAELGKSKKAKQVFIGFALETDEGLKHAGEKLHRKNLDMIILNSLQDRGAGFGYDTNKVSIIDKSGNIDKFELKLKSELAQDIVVRTIKLLNDA